ncbi:uncharacterized protein LOC125199248 [Salvia hispanica]|uniref:uncharacterized protein LOC125199248 n=1 Tax=Salvia hispanica TaxID=49212 RepID=UPI00200956F9|nr:uncharacterized protein LOC125199248 [Salvia hispanica]
MALLGEDGRGYELARKLESQGIWRSWLGDALYSSFIPFLSSPAAWDSFMLPDDSKSRPQISLELRARALLFDKASVSLFAQPTALSKLNPNYLELHGDDVYFTLENGGQDVDQRHQCCFKYYIIKVYSYQTTAISINLLPCFISSNFRTLVELMKDNSKSVAPQTQQQGLGIQGQNLPQQQQPSVQQSQQMLRQMNPQMQQMNNPQFSGFQQQQQQWERMRAATTPATATPTATAETTATTVNTSSWHEYEHEYRQDRPLVQAYEFSPNPTIHSPTMSMARAPPVKVEGFQELMGGDSSPEA